MKPFLKALQINFSSEATTWTQPLIGGSWKEPICRGYLSLTDRQFSKSSFESFPPVSNLPA